MGQNGGVRGCVNFRTEAHHDDFHVHDDALDCVGFHGSGDYHHHDDVDDVDDLALCSSLNAYVALG